MPPGFAVSTSAFRAFVEEAGLARHDRRRDVAHVARTTSTPSARRRTRSARRCASRRCRTRCATRSRGATPSWRRGRRREPPVAVRSSALGEDSQDATFAGQQETYLWVRGADQRLRRRARLLGEPLQRRRRSRYRARLGDGAGAGDGRRRAADGRRRGLGRAVHVQPGERRPEHGRGQRELGARPRGRRRRGDARRLPRQQGDAARSCASTSTRRTSSTCPTPAAAAPSASTCPRSGARRPCLDGAGARRARRRRQARRALLRLATRTSSGRSRGAGAAASLFVLQSRPVTALPRRETAAGAASAMALVMGMFGVREARGEPVALSDDDVREILRIIDESELDELRIETDGLSLHVLRGGAPAVAAAERRAGDSSGRRRGRACTIECADARHLLPRAGAGRGAVRRGRRRGRAGHDRLHHRGDEDDELGPRRASPARSPRSASRTARPSSTARRSSGSSRERASSTSSTRRRATATRASGARPASPRTTSSRSRRRSNASASTRSTSPRARTWRSPCASTARTRGS